MTIFEGRKPEGAPSGVEGNWLKRFSVKLTEWRERALEGAASTDCGNQYIDR